MAVEKPDAWVVSTEAKDNVATGPDKEGVASHRELLKLCLGNVEVIKGTSILLRTVDSLKLVAVKVEGMAACIHIVDDNLDDLTLLQHKGVRIITVDLRIGGESTRGHDTIERRNLGLSISDIIEECVVGTVLLVFHHDVQGDSAVGLSKDFHAIMRHKGYVVKRLELGEGSGSRHLLVLVVCQP